ncbi:MAG: hypothetical protein PHW73_01890 [Atribacterota bacterium]|nr:hypothetical protein [Atribacterota bacterium]
MKVRDKTRKMKEIEEVAGQDIKDLLNELYRNKNMTFQEMEEHIKSKFDIDVDFSTLHYWFMKFGMKSRSFKL